MPNLSTLIFDWSGVISDDRKSVYEANMRLLDHYGKPLMTFEEWLPRTTLSAREFLANHGVTGEPDELFEQYRQELDKVRAKGIHPIIYPDTITSLMRLLKKGKKLIVVSAHPENNLKREAKEYGIERIFKFFVGNSKDKTKGILEVCKRIEVNPSPLNVAYIGDTIYDIIAAKKTRVRAVAVLTGVTSRARLKKYKPYAILKSVALFPSFLGITGSEKK